MKKLVLNLFVILLLLALLTSCNVDNTDNISSASNTQTNIDDTNASANTDTSTAPSTSTDDENNPEPPNIQNSGIIETIQTRKYYREITSAYTTDTDGVVWENDQIFIDGVFEMKRESQYKIITSYEELQPFALLNLNEIEASIFDNNYIVAILHYYIGPSVSASEPVGFYDADFDDGQKIVLDTAYKYQHDSTEDERDIYRLHFIVVPKNEIDNTDEGVYSIDVNVNKLEQHSMDAYTIDTTLEETKAYYVKNENAKDGLEILEDVSKFWTSFPCIAIHLSEPIKTDYIVNGFKYENGEIFITVEIFEKTEMNYLHEISANLIIVQDFLRNEYLKITADDIPPDCVVNVTFENVVAIN